MQIKLASKNIKNQKSLENFVGRKSKRLKKYFKGSFEVQWTCFSEGHQQFKADLKVIGPQYQYHATATSADLGKSLDMVLGKVERQLAKKKEKWRNRLNRNNQNSPKQARILELHREEEQFQEWEEELKSA